MMGEIKGKVTDGQSAVILYDTWQEMLINKEVPDCKRYHNEFFKFYGDMVKSEQAPFYLMFCAFIGAMDICEWMCINGLVENY